MACERWREMLSAQLDGEDDPADRPLVERHVADCAGCRSWLDRAAAVNRLARTGVAAPPTDLTGAVLAALPAPRRSVRRRLAVALYAALAVVGAVQLILGLAQAGGGAVTGHVHTGLGASAGHLWHESAAWNVAVGAGFLVIALRRGRPNGLLPMLTAFVGMLLLLSIDDWTAAQVDTPRLVSHGFVVAGYLLVVALSRVAPDPRPPGDRSAGGSGWRVRLDAAPEPAPAAPPLRLVRGGPLPASRRAA
jgi:predicted anti-sigma-YlaC factor YlaD